MKNTISRFVALALCGAFAAAASAQQVNTYSNPPMPVGRYVSNNSNVTAFGAAAQRSISNELNQGMNGGGCCDGGCCSSGCGGGCCTPSCSTGCCSCACNDCNHCCASKCCNGTCIHRTGAFASYLYLTPRNNDLAFAIPYDGIVPPGGPGGGSVPIGDVAVADLDYSSGFNVGFNLAIDCCSSITASYTWFDTDTSNAITVDAPNVVLPLITLPATFNAGFTAQQARADYDLQYQLVDVDYRALLWSCKGSYVNYTVGARYAHMESSLRSVFPFAQPDGTTFVDADINFDGAGIRFGLEGERRIFRRSGLSVYGKGHISALAGEFNSNYAQYTQFQGEGNTGWSDDRVITISELELGIGWTNRCGNLRVSAGYYFAFWDNVVTMPEYINAVQTPSYVDVNNDDDDNIAFDGLIIRTELLF